MARRQNVTMQFCIKGTENVSFQGLNHTNNPNENAATATSSGLAEINQVNIGLDLNKAFEQFFNNTEEMGRAEFIQSVIEKASHDTEKDYNILIVSLSQLQYCPHYFEDLEKTYTITWKRKFRRHDFQVYIFKSGFIDHRRMFNTRWHLHLRKSFYSSFYSTWNWAWTGGMNFSSPRFNCQTIFGLKNYIVWANANPVKEKPENDYNYVCYWGQRVVRKYFIKTREVSTETNKSTANTVNAPAETSKPGTAASNSSPSTSNSSANNSDTLANNSETSTKINESTAVTSSSSPPTSNSSANNSDPPANNSDPPANNSDPPANNSDPPANNSDPPANNSESATAASESKIITGITIVYENGIETVGEKPSEKDEFIILPPGQVIYEFLIGKITNKRFEKITINTRTNQINQESPRSQDSDATQGNQNSSSSTNTTPIQKHKGIYGRYNKKENYIESIGTFS